MSQFHINYIKKLTDDLEQGNIKSDDLVDSEFSKVTLLQTVLMSDIVSRLKKQYLEKLLVLGCDVDQYGSNSATAISMAASNGQTAPVRLFLNHHKKSHRSDLDILKSAAGSLEADMFDVVLESGKIDTNVTQMRGSHILHHLADVETFGHLIDKVFQYAPDTNPNPIHRKGYSPLTLAINTGLEHHAYALANNGGKIIGNVEDPKFVVELKMTHLYDGDFFNDFPAMVEYAANNGYEDQLPEAVKDLFIF